MSNPKLYVETLLVADAINWTALTSDVMSINITGVGLKDRMKPHASTGRCSVEINNKAKNHQTPVSGEYQQLEVRNRLRVRATTATMGKAIQILHSGYSASTAYLSQTVTQTTANGQVWTVSCYVRGLYKSQLTSLALTVFNGAESFSTTFPVTNRWQYNAFTFTTTLANATMEARFYPNCGDGSGGVSNRQMEMRNFSLRRSGVSEAFANGDFATGSFTPWTSVPVTGTSGGLGDNSNTVTVIDDYVTLFNGWIEAIEPAVLINAGDQRTRVHCVDSTELLAIQKIDLPLQKNKRADQIITAALGQMTQENFYGGTGDITGTIWGTNIDTGAVAYSIALDGYTKNSSRIIDAISDATNSEYGMWWVERDGTVRFANRNYMPRQILFTPRITFQGTPAGTKGQPFTLSAVRDLGSVSNSVNVTYHPRQTVGTYGAVAQINSPVKIPAALGVYDSGSLLYLTQFGTITITLPFRDSVGKVIGADSVVTALVPGLANDYYITDNQTNYIGVDYTSNANFILGTVTASASEVTITMSNKASGPLYANRLQVRGYPIYKYDPITISRTNATSIAKYQERTYNLDLPFCDDPGFADSLATYLVGRYSIPFLEVQDVTVAHKSQINGVDLLTIEPTEVVYVSDDQAGFTSLAHMVSTIDISLSPQATDWLSSITFHMFRVDMGLYGLWDDATYGKWDTALWYI